MAFALNSDASVGTAVDVVSVIVPVGTSLLRESTDEDVEEASDVDEKEEEDEEEDVAVAVAVSVVVTEAEVSVIASERFSKGHAPVFAR